MATLNDATISSQTKDQASPEEFPGAVQIADGADLLADHEQRQRAQNVAEADIHHREAAVTAAQASARRTLTSSSVIPCPPRSRAHPARRPAPLPLFGKDCLDEAAGRQQPFRRHVGQLDDGLG